MILSISESWQLRHNKVQESSFNIIDAYWLYNDVMSFYEMLFYLDNGFIINAQFDPRGRLALDGNLLMKREIGGRIIMLQEFDFRNYFGSVQQPQPVRRVYLESDFFLHSADVGLRSYPANGSFSMQHGQIFFRLGIV